MEPETLELLLCWISQIKNILFFHGQGGYESVIKPPKITFRGLITKSQKGFTLIEMLTALSILSIGFLSLFELQIIAIKGNKRSKNLTSAVILAETKVEDLIKNGFANLSNGVFQDTNNPVNEVGAPGGIFTRTWTIADYKGSMHIKKITATIEWPHLKKKCSISLDTLLSDFVDKAY